MEMHERMVGELLLANHPADDVRPVRHGDQTVAGIRFDGRSRRLRTFEILDAQQRVVARSTTHPRRLRANLLVGPADESLLDLHWRWWPRTFTIVHPERMSVKARLQFREFAVVDENSELVTIISDLAAGPEPGDFRIRLLLPTFTPAQAIGLAQFLRARSETARAVSQISYG